MTKYIAIPADKSGNWNDILDHAETLGIYGNDFMGSRQYNAPSGKLVFKLDTDN